MAAFVMQAPSFTFSGRWAARVVVFAAALICVAWAMAARIDAALALPWISWADEHVEAWLHAHASPVAMQAFTVLTALHGTLGILAMAALCGAFMWRSCKRALWPLLMASVPGGLMLNAAVKQAVQRARPAWGYAYKTIESYSFPSGHTAGATVLYGFVLLLLWPSLRTSLHKTALLLGSVAMVMLVAASRIALGVHFLSDCVAAACEGALWLAVCWAGVRLLPSKAPLTRAHGVAG